MFGFGEFVAMEETFEDAVEDVLGLEKFWLEIISQFSLSFFLNMGLKI